MVTWDLVLLATFFVRPDPAAASLHKMVTHFHLERSVGACEGIDHDADQRAVAQPDKRRFLRFRTVRAGPLDDGLDAVEQLAGLCGREHGRLALADDLLEAAHGVGRVCVEYVAGDEPVEAHPQRGRVLLDSRRGELALQIPDEGGAWRSSRPCACGRC